MALSDRAKATTISSVRGAMTNSKIEKLLDSYAAGNQVKATTKLMKLAISGNPEAQYYASLIFSENGLRFLADDSWVDLLVHQVEPRDLVTKNHYETLVWLGNISEARTFLTTENLLELNPDLEARDFVQDVEKLRKALAARILASKKNEKNAEITSDERRLKDLEIRAGLGYISAQVYFSGSSLELGASMMTSGDEIFQIDLDSYLHSPEKYWSDLLLDSADLLREEFRSAQPKEDFVSKLATFAQDIAERLFFLKGSFSIATQNEKYALSAIAFGLEPIRPVATRAYLGLFDD